MHWKRYKLQMALYCSGAYPGGGGGGPGGLGGQEAPPPPSGET